MIALPKTWYSLRTFSALFCFLFLASCSQPKPKRDLEWDRVMLASFPRSGNHWTRYLLEEATGVATCSVYYDRYPPHLKTPFDWGGFCPPNGYEGNRRYPGKGDIVVVKTHHPTYDWMHSPFDYVPFRKIVRLVRNPIDCFYSFYVWQCRHSKKHIEPIIPHEFLVRYIAQYRRFQDYYNARKDVVTFTYEALLENPEKILAQITKAMGYKLKPADIQRAVKRYPPQGTSYKSLAHYRPEDLQLIQQELGDLMKQFSYQIPS